MEDYRYLFKIVLIGNPDVGKTCLVRRFTQGVFPAAQGATIGVDFMIKTLLINGVKVKLQIWDTAGQERFRSITQSYYRSAHCLILVYDIASLASFDSLPQWDRDIEQYAGATRHGRDANSGLLKVLVGNKCDKARDIPTHIGEAFAQQHRYDIFMETSALQSDNVERLFYEIAEDLLIRNQQQCSSSSSGMEGESMERVYQLNSNKDDTGRYCAGLCSN